MSRRITVVRGAIAVLGVLLSLALGVLSGCGPEGEGAGGGSGTTLRPAEGALGPEPPANVAEAAASGIDESSIRAPGAPDGRVPGTPRKRRVTIAERGSAEGRKAAAEYMELSFEEVLTGRA